MIQSYTYKGKKPGKKLLILGAIHGNEKAGTIAIQKIMEDLENGVVVLENGSVVCVPIANPQAYEHDIRYCACNMNRMFGGEKEECLEGLFVEEISRLIEEADVVLDLHTNHFGDMSFIFVDRDDVSQEVNRAHSLDVDMYVHGWKRLYGGSGGTTSEYAHAHGKLSLTVECGDHHSPCAPTRAYDYIIKTLSYFEHIQPVECDKPRQSQVIMMEQVVYKNNNLGLLLPDGAKHGDAMIHGGEQYVILLPYHDAQKGDERFYIGKDITHIA